MLFRFDAINYDFVFDHCPKEDPVIPFVCVIDAFFKVVKKEVDNKINVIKNIEIINGLVVPNFDFLDVQINVDKDKKQLIMQGLDQKIHYKCEFDFEDKDFEDKAFPDIQFKESTELFEKEYEKIFHGKKLQSVVTWDKIDETSAYVSVKNAKSMLWHKNDWIIDPAETDGCLQACCVMAIDIKNKNSLPVKIGKVRIFDNVNKSDTQQAFIKINYIKNLKYGASIYIKDTVIFEDIEIFFRSK